MHAAYAGEWSNKNVILAVLDVAPNREPLPSS